MLRENIVASPAWMKIDSPATEGISASRWSSWLSAASTKVSDLGVTGGVYRVGQDLKGPRGPNLVAILVATCS